MRKTFLAAACAAMLLVPASMAQGAEVLYWGNLGSRTVSFADVGGSGGGSLNLGGIGVREPSGMAIDTATGRLLIADFNGGSAGTGQIVAANLDGSGATVFSAPGAPVDHPIGLTIDPFSRTAYWANFDGNSIAWARLDGSGGDTVNTTGATLVGPAWIAVDPGAGRVYWANDRQGSADISFANVNNSGGGDLNLDGASIPMGITGLSVDPAAGRIYWIDSLAKRISYANVNGSGAADVPTPNGAPIASPFGLALDPTIGRFYWGNSGKGQERTGAFGFAGLSGAGGVIDIATAPVNQPDIPVILKSPAGTSAPVLTRSAQSNALSCSQGAWAPDFAGSFVYRAPSKFAYQWLRDGKPIGGATAATLSVKSSGSYACSVTASNQAGSAAQASAPAMVAARLKLIVKKKLPATAGKLARLKIGIKNVGNVASSPVRLCAKIGKRAKVRAPKCKPLGAIPGGASRSGILKLKIAAGASGAYEVTFGVRGFPSKPAKAKILVR
jgi:hypothetical protein